MWTPRSPGSVADERRREPKPPGAIFPRTERTLSRKGFVKSRSRHSFLRTRYAAIESSSAGAAPQAPSVLEHTSPLTTGAATGKSRSIHPPRCCRPHNRLSILEAKRRHPPRLGKCRDPWASTTDSYTGTPHREYHLHGLVVVARVELQRGKEESERTYSVATLPGNLNLETLGPKLPPTPPAGKSLTISATSRRSTGHRRWTRPPTPPAVTRSLFSASLNCSRGAFERVGAPGNHDI
jgi:hypothetical protein